MREISLEAPINPTEDADKICAAIRNLFPDAALQVSERSVTGSANSTERFAEILRDNKIRDTGRAQILKRRSGNRTLFYLNKQAATVGKVNFVSEDELLGPIEVRICDDDLDALVYEIAPSTRIAGGTGK